MTLMHYHVQAGPGTDKHTRAQWYRSGPKPTGTGVRCYASDVASRPVGVGFAGSAAVSM